MANTAAPTPITINATVEAVAFHRPPAYLVVAAQAVNRAKSLYDAAPIGVALEDKVQAALARIDKASLKRIAMKKGDKVGVRLLALMRTELGRKPKGLPVELLKSGDFKADVTATVAVREWAALAGAVEVLAMLD